MSINKNKSTQSFKLDCFPTIKLGNVLCYKRDIICLIVAIKESTADEDKLYFGVDKIGAIYSGYRDDWSPIIDNLQLLNIYAENKYVLRYTKEKVMESIARMYSKDQIAFFKKVSDTKNIYELLV